MKIKTTVLVIGLATSGLVSCLAQDNNNNPPPQPAPAEVAPANPNPAQPAPAEVTPGTPAPANPATPAPAVTPAPAGTPAPTVAPAPAEAAQGQAAPAAADKTDAAPAAPVNPNDPVPLIVIDEVPLTDAIRNLARQSNLNFQFDPRITMTNQPNVSIRFENVSAQEALTAVLENYNLVLVKEPKSKIARITIKDPKAEDPLVSRIIQLKYSDPTNLVALVKSTLSPRSTVVADARTSQLIVTTTEKEQDAVVILVTTLDTPTKQVLIEGNLLETSRNPSTIKGIDWAGTLEAQSFSFGNNLYAPPSAQSLNNLVTVPPTPRLLVDTAKGFNPATAFLDADGVSAVLSFLNKEADTEVVATPRAVTLDNQMATLAVTRAFPVFQITPGSANSPAGASITYTNLGTILRVTPRIAADRNISLMVQPEVSNIDSVDKQTLNGTINTANIYAIRRIETHVMIPSGNTLVMGGLINDTKTKSYTKVPVLGDLPGIGLAFRKEGKTRNKQNLIIFITPTIVEDEAFHLTSSGTEYLKNDIPPQGSDEAETAWDSAKPHDWTRPASKQ